MAPVELGRAELIRSGDSGAVVVFGALLSEAVRAADRLAAEGIELTVVNARFCRPLDFELIGRLIRELPFVVTVEESTLMGGFGSAVLEAANAAGLRTEHIRRLGIPDRFIEHGERNDLLRDLGLDAEGIAETCRQLAQRFGTASAEPRAGHIARTPQSTLHSVAESRDPHTA